MADNIRFGRPDASRIGSDAASSSPATPEDLRARGGRFAELFDRWVAGAA